MIIVLAIGKHNLYLTMEKTKLFQLEEPRWLDAPALNRLTHPLEEGSEKSLWGKGEMVRYVEGHWGRVGWAGQSLRKQDNLNGTVGTYQA